MPTPLDRLAAGVFVGREQELERSCARRSTTRCPGSGRLVMLVGEPGIGKTRTPRSSRPTRACAARRCSGAAATRARARRPTGRGCRSSASYVHDTRSAGSSLSEMGPGAGRHRAGRLRGARAAARPAASRHRSSRSRRASGSSTASRRSSRTPPARDRWCSSSTTCTGRTSPRCCCCSSSRRSCRVSAARGGDLS